MAILNKIPFCVLFYRKHGTLFAVEAYGNVRFCYHADTKESLAVKIASTFKSYEKLWGRKLILLAEVNV